MTFTETIKQYILGKCGMDAVGIAPAETLEDERICRRPEDVLPGAKSLIVFLKHVPDGVTQAAFRSKEDGNRDAYSIYAAFGRELTPNMHLFFMQFNIAQYIERNFGHAAVPVSSGPMHCVSPVNTELPVFVGAKQNSWIIHPGRAAVAAGLGEIAWNNVFVTAEYGPRVGIGIIVTNMELEYDEPYSGPKLCDPEKCGVCVRLCPTHAIPAPGGEGAAETFEIAGKTCTTGCVNSNACAVASMAFRKEFSWKPDVPDQILNDDPSDEELKKAYAEKPLSSWSLAHFPNYYCDLCRLYCPLGNWKERFGDTGLSHFREEASGR